MLRRFVTGTAAALLCPIIVSSAVADLKEIRERGMIRHLGVPYANFITGDGDGLDTEIIKLYAKEIGVKYEYVKSSWATVISDVSGKEVSPKGDEVDITGESEVRGDIIGNGLTFLTWRAKVIDYSLSYFPTAIWVVARADSDFRPVPPSDDIKSDVEATKTLLMGREVLGVRNTCVDPKLYDLKEVTPRYKENIGLNDLAPAVIKGDAALCILDVPDTLVALEKYPGLIKVLGPITEKQFMGFGISKDSPELLASFNAFLAKLQKNGKLTELIVKYYPVIRHYFSTAGQE
jgi:ABC-type amino acid transport substrate-binding protein